MRGKMKWFLASMVLCLLASNIQASLVTVGFTGVVKKIIDLDNLLDDSVFVGQTITGSYIYDTTATLVISSPVSRVGYYYYTSIPNVMVVNVGNYTFQTDPSNVDTFVSIINDAEGNGSDEFGFFSNKNLPISDNLILDRMYCDFYDPTGTAFSSLELPATVPVLTDWQRCSCTINGGTDETFKTQFILHLTITEIVPEPMSLSLLGLGGLLLIRRN